MQFQFKALYPVLNLLVRIMNVEKQQRNGDGRNFRKLMHK